MQLCGTKKIPNSSWEHWLFREVSIKMLRYWFLVNMCGHLNPQKVWGHLLRDNFFKKKISLSKQKFGD